MGSSSCSSLLYEVNHTRFETKKHLPPPAKIFKATPLVRKIMTTASYHNTNRTCDRLWRSPLQMGDYESPPLQFQPRLQWFRPLWTLTNDLVDKQFATYRYMKQAVNSWLLTIYTDFLYAGFQALGSQWNTCLNICGHYAQGSCII
jgi:hypothetical protein